MKRIIVYGVFLASFLFSKNVTIVAKIYNSHIFDRSANDTTTNLIVPDTNEVFPGAYIVVQQMNQDSTYTTIASGVTDSTGRAVITANVTGINEESPIQGKPYRIGYTRGGIGIFTTNNKDARIQVFDMSGRKKLEEIVDETIISSKDLGSDGLYALVIRTDKGQDKYKLVKMGRYLFINTAPETSSNRIESVSNPDPYEKDRRLRIAVITPDTTGAILYYPLEVGDTIPDTINFRTVLFRARQPIKWVYRNGVLMPTDSVDTRSDYVQDLGYNNLWLIRPIIKEDPRYLWVSDSTSGLPKKLPLIRIYRNVGDTVNFAADSTIIRQVFGITVNDTGSWAYYTGIPLISQIVYVTASDSWHRHIQNMAVILDNGNFTLQEPYVSMYTIDTPYAIRAANHVTAMDLLWIESLKAVGMREIDKYSPSIFNEPATIGHPSRLDAANARIYEIFMLARELSIASLQNGSGPILVEPSEIDIDNQIATGGIFFPAVVVDDRGIYTGRILEGRNPYYN